MDHSSASTARPWHRSDGLGLHRLTLKFPDPNTEREFLRHSTSDVLASFSLYGAFLLATTLTAVGVVYLFHVKATVMYPQQQVDQGIATASIVAFSVSLMMTGGMHSLREKLRPLIFEVVAMFIIICMCSFLFAVHAPFMARLKGHDPAGCADDGTLVLNLCSTVMAAHVFLPIRWCVLIPAQIYPVAFYGLLQIFFSLPECSEIADFPVYGQSKAWKVLNLFFAILVASVGKRNAELQARELFMRVIRERTHRVESEFQLDQLQQAGALPSPPTAPSLPDSVPTTTSTNRVFELGESTTWQQLATIAELGRKEQWLIETAELTWMPERILGMGGFGIVTQGTYLGLSIAMKVPKYPPETYQNHSAVMELCNELKILRRISHPNILTFYGACMDDNFRDVALVLELVSGVSLRDFVAACPCVAEKARILQEISCALCYLHTQNPRVVHGDLKDTNCYVQQGGEKVWGAAKLLDFGLARQITKRARPLGGSIAWMAPEVAVSQPLPGTPADVFSLGRVTFFVVTGVSPAHGRNRGALVRQLRRGVAPTLSWPEMNPFSSKFKDIVDRCSADDPSLRPSIIDLRQSFAQKRLESLGAGDVCHEADLHVQLQLVRKAAARWQRRAPPSQSRHRHEALGAAAARRAQATLDSLPEDAVAADVIGASSANLLHPAFAPTPMQTQAEIVAPALVRCNFRLAASTCCTYHASVNNLRDVVDWLAAKRCMPLAEPIGGQCEHCGALLVSESGSDADFCEFCGDSGSLS